MAQLIRADEVALQPWRNGGGQTRELLAWPSIDHCRLRIAVADIAADGPFSAYEGVERWIVVIEGVGIELTFNHGERRLFAGDDPLCFDGADAPNCRLLNGPTRDLNLMAQGGRGLMRPVQSGAAWSDDFALRGVFAARAGRWSDEGGSRHVPARSLLWFGAHTTDNVRGDWTFDYDVPQPTTQAWWLGFTPSE